MRKAFYIKKTWISLELKRVEWLRFMGKNSKREQTIKGILVKEGVKVHEESSIEKLSAKGYGVSVEDGLLLKFYEALYLLGKGAIEILDGKGKPVDFECLLKSFRNLDENAWVKYLTYRDLRSRGYVVREGFGLGIDFRVYERGEYGKEAAKYLILSIQEGKPILLDDLMQVLRRCQSLKKKLILAVMNRRGETVYYSISKLTLK